MDYGVCSIISEFDGCFCALKERCMGQNVWFSKVHQCLGCREFEKTLEGIRVDGKIIWITMSRI